MEQTPFKFSRVLAISLSARGFGFVVMEGEKSIVECATRVADSDKNDQSIAKMEKLLKFYRPTTLVLQDVETKCSRHSSRIKTLNRQIARLAGKHAVKVKFISGTKIRSLLLGNPMGRKQELAEMLALQFPNELASRLPPKRKRWKSEHSRMDIFDAVGVALAFWRAGNGLQ